MSTIARLNALLDDYRNTRDPGAMSDFLRELRDIADTTPRPALNKLCARFKDATGFELTVWSQNERKS
jgi:thiaminase